MICFYLYLSIKPWDDGFSQHFVPEIGFIIFYHQKSQNLKILSQHSNKLPEESE